MSITPWLLGCGRGGGANRSIASISVSTPKFFSADPKYTGVISPWR